MFELRNVRHAYNGVDALQVPDWRAEQGQHWLVIGPSGSGKTTLLHVLAGILKVSYGEVLVAGERLDKLKPRKLDRFRSRHVGLVLQRLHLLSSLTVFDNVLIAQDFAQEPQDRDRVREVLAALGLEKKAKAYPDQLSFGQAQRLAVARAVVNRPTLLLADEPTSNLDDVHCMRALDLLQAQARACRATLLIATHDQRIKARVPRQFRLGAAT
jgi:putative ABC transport system ATP-binding protein